MTSILNEAVDLFKEARRLSWLVGVSHGLKLALEFRRASGGIEVGLPGLSLPVNLRAGTSDIDVFREVFVRRELDLDYGSTSPELVIDAGAYTGLTTVFLARRFPEAIVVAIEPERSNHDLLCRNTQSFPNVRVVHAALWNESGLRLPLATCGRNWSTRVGGGEGEQRAPTVTISDILELAGKDRVDLLKVDIEGAEIEVFESEGGKWLHLTRRILIELHDFIRPGCSLAFYRALTRRPFVQRVVGEKLFVVLEPDDD